MYGQDRVKEVLELVEADHRFSEIFRKTGVSRWTIRSWARGDLPRRRARAQCAVCAGSPNVPSQGPYAYLLGLYLGDGCISSHPRGVFKLQIVCCNAYPWLIGECELAIAEVLPNRVGRVPATGCTVMSSYSKHWPCLFPQHGPGAKYKRPIQLASCQQAIVGRFPAPFLRGLLHSDGCRVLNWVNSTAYPRYHFSNASADIRALFGAARDRLRIQWTPNNAHNLSVARRASVAMLDEFVGPKRRVDLPHFDGTYW